MDLFVMFQSPSLRGSGRFFLAGPHPLWERAMFQSPSLRGSGRFGLRPLRGRPGAVCFNPLHCGAVVASSRADRRRA